MHFILQQYKKIEIINIQTTLINIKSLLKCIQNKIDIFYVFFIINVYELIVDCGT